MAFKYLPDLKRVAAQRGRQTSRRRLRKKLLLQNIEWQNKFQCED